MKTKILNFGKIIAFSTIAFLTSKNSFAQCTTPTFQDDLNSATGWTLVDPAFGNGSLPIQAGEMHFDNSECTTTNGVHNNREVRRYRSVAMLNNFIWRAECRIRISDGNAVSQTFMGFTAGNACPQALPSTEANTWDCATGSTQSNTLGPWTNQDGIFASLIAFGYNSNSSDPNNQIPNSNVDQPFNPANQNTIVQIPTNLGWRIYGHAVDGSNSAFFGTGTARSSNFVGTIPPNRSRGIALPALATVYFVRLERLTASNCRISVFSDAAMSQHVPGSPQCFDISPTIQNLNTLQNFAHVSGSKFRRVRGEVDFYRVFNGCATTPNFTITATNITSCSNVTNTLTATPGAVSYSWTTSGGTTITSTNSLQITPSSTTIYTITASFPDACPISITHTVTVVPQATFTLSVSSTPTICAGTPIIANATVSGNTSVQWYTWILDECDANGNPNGGYTTGMNFIAGPYSGGNYQFPNSANLPCNKLYRIKLAVQNLNQCQPWVEKYTYVYVACTPAPVITGPNIACFGTSVTLCVNYMPSSNSMISWLPVKKSGNNTQCTVFTPTTTTTYSVVVTNQYGCQATATTNISVLDNNPDFLLGGDLISSTTYTCRATPVSQSALSNPNFSYSWIVEEIDKTTGNVVNLTTVVNPWTCWTPLYGIGTNKFSGYDGSNNFNCGNPSVGHFNNDSKYRITRGTWITNVCPWQQISHTIHLCYGCKTADGNPKFIIEEDNTAPDFSYLMNNQAVGSIKNNATLNVFPNPSNGLLNINVKNAIDSKYNVEVFDIYGKLIHKKDVLNDTGNEFNAEINLSNLNLSNGLYLINVISENQKSSQRIVIEK